MNIEFQIAKLKSENRELKARLDALEERDGRKVLPAPPVEPAVKVTTPAPVSGFVMPTDDELDRLSTIRYRDVSAVWRRLRSRLLWIEGRARRGLVAAIQSGVSCARQFQAARSTGSQEVLIVPRIRR
jgi:hypothetical protein